MTRCARRRRKLALFGHFDSTNFGNESTLLAAVRNFRYIIPNIELACISTGPEAVTAVHHIQSIPVGTVSKSPQGRNPIVRIGHWICTSIPHEIYQWFSCFAWLGDTDVLIIPGTGLLTDAYGLTGWGPYNLFKWSVMAKLRRCKLLFVGVGVGPIYGTIGRYFVKSALSLADFRSYRDSSSKKYLERIGFHVVDDHIYPDLAFSLPETLIPPRSVRTGRQVVGVGLMANSGKYGIAGPNSRVHLAYLNNLAIFVTWLLAHDYDIRLLIGDVGDIDTVHEFRQMLRDCLPSYDERRVISEPMSTVEDLLAQIAETDVVIATRFHNVLLSLLCNKPVISISFHHKCASLMKVMDLEAYCVDIRNLDVNYLIETFKAVKLDSHRIELRIKDKIREHRNRLYEQYEIIANIINN